MAANDEAVGGVSFLTVAEVAAAGVPAVAAVSRNPRAPRTQTVGA